MRRAVDVYGVGVDIQAIDAVRTALEEEGGEQLRLRVFSAEEIRYCEARGARRYQHYAARWAAKEAFLKALGVTRAQGVAWRDIRCVRDTGAPRLLLVGRARQCLGELRLDPLLSLSHSGDYAVAVVLLRRRALRPGRGAAAAIGRPERG